MEDEFPVDAILFDEFPVDTALIEEICDQCDEAAVGGLSGLDRDDDWRSIVNQTLKPGQRMKINATAGSGKTTVLADYAKKWSEHRYCYLCFNKVVQAEKGRVK